MEKVAQYIFKIILIGDSGVGKTSLMARFTDNTYDSSSLTTIGVDFKIKTMDLDGTRVKLQIWDTAGQERFRAMVSNYYRGAHGIFIVFDMLNHRTFEHLVEWLNELKKKDAMNTGEIMILGNKIDDKEKICVKMDEINAFLDSNKLPRARFVQVSAKNDIGVEESFLELTKRLIEKCGAKSGKANSKTKLVLDLASKRMSCC